MDGGDWISLAGVIVSGGFALWSAVSATRAKASQVDAEKRAEAALKAERAAVAAQRDIAAEVKRAADLSAAVAARDDADRAAIEETPWDLQSIPNDSDIWLVNRSPTPKYGVRVSGESVYHEDDDEEFDAIGPGARKEVGVYRTNSLDESIVIRWHQQKDRSDVERSCTETLPSSI